MSAPAPRRIDALDVSVDVLTAALTAHPDEALAYREAAFLVTHPDAPVSTMADYPGWVPAHMEPGVYPDTSSPADFAASRDVGYNPPIDWTVDPPESTRTAPGPVCAPAFVQKPSVDVPVVGDAL